MSYTDYYPDGDLSNQPVAETRIKPGDVNASALNDMNGMGGQGGDITDGTYSKVVCTTTRIAFSEMAGSLVYGAVHDPNSDGLIKVPEGQTLVIEGPVDTTGWSFSASPGCVMHVAAFN